MCSYVSEAHMTAKDFREYAEEQPWLGKDCKVNRALPLLEGGPFLADFKGFEGPRWLSNSP